MSAAKSNDDVCLCMTLRRASRAATRLYDEWMKESGLKITQFSLLRNIGRAGTIHVTELARRLELERTAMGRNLDLLTRKGLIRNVGDDPDLRKRTVALTAEGERVQLAAEPVWRRAQAEMRRRLSKGAFASLHAVVAELQSAKA